VRVDTAFAAMVITALVIGLVVQVVAQMQRDRSRADDRSSFVVFGSGDTLVILGLSAYLGMNILYALAIATIISTFYLAIHQALFPRLETDEPPRIPFLPALYVGFVSTKFLEICFSQGRIETLNAITQHIFSFSNLRGY
jgi:prepilin signal peptidase PulO-like enzyme (type II secretory pathway)